MTTGIVVHNKKQNAAAASLLHQDNDVSSGDQVEGVAIVLETESTTMDDNIIKEEVANIQEEVATNVIGTGEAEVEASPLPNTSSPTFTTDYPTLSPTIEPTLGPTLESAASVIIETPAIQERPKTEQSNQKPPKEATTSVTVTREKMTYRPGDLTVSMNGLLLSAGLTATIIAKSGKPVI